MDFLIKLKNYLLLGEWGIFFIVGFMCKNEIHTTIIKAKSESDATEKLKKKYCKDINIVTIKKF